MYYEHPCHSGRILVSYKRQKRDVVSFPTRGIPFFGIGTVLGKKLYKIDIVLEDSPVQW